MDSHKICIIGPGRLGTTISAKIAEKKDPAFMIKAISARKQSTIDKAKAFLKEKSSKIDFYTDNKKAVEGTDTVLICTPDDKIAEVDKELFTKKNLFKKPEKINVIHFSGSKPLKALKHAKKTGMHIASTHPMKSFASIDSALKTLDGTIFGITFSDPVSETASRKLVSFLGGIPIVIDDEKKALYHASACIASNYLVALIDLAVRIMGLTGAGEKEALDGLSGLIEGTVKNIKSMGTKKALTGPIARGDINTIKEHVKDMALYADKDDISAYNIMAIETGKIALYNNWIDRGNFNELLKALKKE